MNNKNSDWRLEGRYFETCNCVASCPCVWLQPPTDGDCKLLSAWHIASGHMNGTHLDSLNVAMACYAPELMIKGGWKAALYIDDRADAAQTEAITHLFSGKAGGHLSVLMSFVGEIWGVKLVAMEYSEDGNTRHLSIPGIAEAEIQNIQGTNGGESIVSNPPLCVVASHPSVVAKSRHYRYRDYGQTWEFSERNGYHSAFIHQP